MMGDSSEEVFRDSSDDSDEELPPSYRVKARKEGGGGSKDGENLKRKAPKKAPKDHRVRLPNQPMESKRKARSAKGIVTPESLGLEVWIEFHGKRAPQEEVDGNRVVIMEAAAPRVTTPYSIFVKNNSDRDLHVRLDTDKARGKLSYVVKKLCTRQLDSFNGALLGFKVVPHTGKRGTDDSDQASHVLPEFRHFIFQVKTVVSGPSRYKPRAKLPEAGNDVFGDDGEGASHVGVSCKKKVELVSPGPAPDLKGHRSCKYRGEKLGKFMLYYASVADMAVVRNRRLEEEQARSKAKHGAAKRKSEESGGVSVKAEAKVDKQRPKQKKLKVQVIIDLISDEEIEVD